MIYNDAYYFLNLNNPVLIIRKERYHDFYISKEDAVYKIPDEILFELNRGYCSKYSTPIIPSYYLRVDCGSGAEVPYVLYAGEGDKRFEIPVALDADEITNLYCNRLDIPSFTAEIKAEIAELPDWVQATADDAEKVHKMAKMMLTLARHEVRKANPDFLNVPHWDDLEMTAAYATIDRWQKAMNIE